MQCLEETDSKNEFILIEYKYDNRIPGSTEKKSFYPKRKKTNIFRHFETLLSLML